MAVYATVYCQAGTPKLPTVSVAVSGLRTAATTYKNEATVTVTASDTGTGLASTSYSLDGAAFAPYTAPVKVSTPGSHTVRARAQDVAGNVATTTVSTFSVVTAGASRASIAVENAGHREARAIPSRLGDLAEALAAAGPTGPVVLLIGETAARSPAWNAATAAMREFERVG